MAGGVAVVRQGVLCGCAIGCAARDFAGLNITDMV